MIRGAAAGERSARRQFSELYLPVVRACLEARWHGREIRNEVDDAVQEVFVECLRDTRVFAIAGNVGDTPENLIAGRDRLGFPVRVLHDPDQAAIAALGGTNTPHFMLVDDKGTMHYRGALNNDYQGLEDEDKQVHYLADALGVLAGKPGVTAPPTETSPPG